MVIIIAIISSISNDWFGGLRIENLPDKITTQNFDRPKITFNFKNHGNEDVQDYHIIMNTTHPSENHMAITEISFDQVIGDGGSREETITPIRISDDEGSELWHTLNWYLYANGEFEKHYSISIVIESNSQSFPLYREGANDKSLIFSELSTTSLELNGDNKEEKTIEFRIKNNKGGSFDDIRIVPFIDNHSGGYLEILAHEEDEKLDTKGEDTGSISIPVKALKSTADKIKYQVQLVLLNGNTQMDTKMIDVIIKSN